MSLPRAGVLISHPMKSKCLNCGSEEILPDVRVLDRGDGNSSNALTLETFEGPKALVFKGTRQAEVKARVCKNCGFVMLFAHPCDVENLQRALDGG